METSATFATSSKLLLIIDDDAGFVASAIRSAATVGWRALAFPSFVEGFAAICRHRPARLVFEPFLPSGYEILNILSAIRAELPALVAYAVSAYPSVAMALKLVRASAVVDYLTKPVSARLLASTLDRPLVTEDSASASARDVPSLARVEWEYITWVLARCEGNVSAAAALLGVARNTLQRRLRKHPPRR
jgi:two-component system response regulator RegA